MNQLFAAFGLLALLVGCAHGSPPNAFERTAYVVTTNFVTNVNAQVVFGPSNNIIATNYFAQVEPRYHFEPRPEVVTGIQTVGQVGGMFGLPWLTPLLALLASAYAGYAKWESARRGLSNKVLTNNVQVGRETILAVAGAAAEAEFVDAISSAQVKAGVKDDIAAIVDSKVDKKEAREEAESVVSLAKKRPVVAP